MGVTTIGEALVAKRLDLGLEKGQAAQRIGMSRTTYSSYEQDAQRPSIDVFSALADFLDISVEALLTLYGATCIAQARTSLDRAAAHPVHKDVVGVPAKPDAAIDALHERGDLNQSGSDAGPVVRGDSPNFQVAIEPPEQGAPSDSEVSLEVKEVQKDLSTSPHDSEQDASTSRSVGTGSTESEVRETGSSSKKKKKKKKKKG